jgi:beta-N-acetylhexosaminidase
MAERVEAVGEATSLADRKRRAGQRLFIGFAGPAVTDDLRALVKTIQPAGFVLFRRNVEEPAQVRELNRELASLVDARHPAFLAVDQEGGRVQRVKAPATVWPAMRRVGQAAERPRGRDLALTEDVSRAMAKELRALGFNLNFAPVADIDSNPDNPIIGDRSFGRVPDVVAQHVVAFAKAHQEQGVIACAKHFPGHGDTAVDSHLALPKVELDIAEIEHRELVPFRAAIQAGIATIMTAHILFPAYDEEVPATLSPRIIRGVLREQLGFQGVVFSDDLEMKAVHGRWPIAESARRMTEATVDILLCCEDPTLQVEAYESLVRLQEEDSGLEKASIAAVKRVEALRERFFLKPLRQPGLEVLASESHQALARRVAADSDGATA